MRLSTQEKKEIKEYDPLCYRYSMHLIAAHRSYIKASKNNKRRRMKYWHNQSSKLHAKLVRRLAKVIDEKTTELTSAMFPILEDL